MVKGYLRIVVLVDANENENENEMKWKEWKKTWANPKGGTEIRIPELKNKRKKLGSDELAILPSPFFQLPATCGCWSGPAT